MGSRGEDFCVHQIFGIFENVNFLEIEKRVRKKKESALSKRQEYMSRLKLFARMCDSNLTLQTIRSSNVASSFCHAQKYMLSFGDWNALIVAATIYVVIVLYTTTRRQMRFSESGLVQHHALQRIFTFGVENDFEKNM